MEEKDLQQPNNKQQTPQPASGEAAGSSQLDELSKKLAETEKQVEYYKDLLLRKAAEFDNYKKRVDNEAATVLKFAKVDLITELLPIVDDFERSLKQSNNQKDADAFTKGIDLIYQKFMKFLESQGLKAMETVGKEFNVHYHDALLQMQRTDVPPHTIIEEVEKGYLLEDRVIRHAKVIVSNSPAEHETTGSDPDKKETPEGSNGTASKNSDAATNNSQTEKG